MHQRVKNLSELKFLAQYRSSLSGLTGLEVDASILDEARINRPGAKTYEYKVAPKFGTYRYILTSYHHGNNDVTNRNRPPVGKMMKDVRDKYVFNKKESEVLMDKVSKCATSA